MNPNIIITGITSFRNHGVEALVRSTVTELRRRIPTASFTVLDRAPDYDSFLMAEDDVSFQQDFSIRSLYASKLRRLANQLVPLSDRLAENTSREIRSASAVIASGGDVFCSEYGHRSLCSHLRPLVVACEAKVPVILHAQSVGPFSNERDREAFLRVARQASLITVRESASYRYLLEDLGLPEELVHLVADPAFLLGQPKQVYGDRLFAHYVGTMERPTVALSVSQAICHWKGGSDDSHLKAWIEIVRWLRRDLNANVILIPHVQEVSAQNDDRVLASKIQKEMSYDPAVRLAGGDLSAEEYKAIISRCDFLVAERMHAAIAGLSTAVPTMVVGYSIKAQGILQDLVGADLTKGLALISIEDFIKQSQGRNRVERAWNNRHQMVGVLQSSLLGIQQRSSRAFDLAAALICKKERIFHSSTTCAA